MTLNHIDLRSFQAISHFAETTKHGHNAQGKSRLNKLFLSLSFHVFAHHWLI